MNVKFSGGSCGQDNKISGSKKGWKCGDCGENIKYERRNLFHGVIYLWPYDGDCFSPSQEKDREQKTKQKKMKYIRKEITIHISSLMLQCTRRDYKQYQVRIILLIKSVQLHNFQSQIFRRHYICQAQPETPARPPGC